MTERTTETVRYARCIDATSGEFHGKYGHPSQPRPSSPDLPMFQARPDRAFDEFYCGCWGWD